VIKLKVFKTKPYTRKDTIYRNLKKEDEALKDLNRGLNKRLRSSKMLFENERLEITNLYNDERKRYLTEQKQYENTIDEAKNVIKSAADKR
jgi:hypothetical protein